MRQSSLRRSGCLPRIRRTWAPWLLSNLCCQTIDVAGGRSQVPITPLNHLYSVPQPLCDDVNAFPLGHQIRREGASQIVNRAFDPTASEVTPHDLLKVISILPHPQLFCGAKREFTGIPSLEEYRQKVQKLMSEGDGTIISILQREPFIILDMNQPQWPSLKTEPANPGVCYFIPPQPRVKASVGR
jgi:hypothetical protein